MLKQQPQPPVVAWALIQHRSRPEVGYFRSAFLRAAQRAFIRSESLFRPAALSRRLRGAAPFEPPRRALSLAQRALAAAAIFARAAAERGRRPPPLGLAPAVRPPNKLENRRSSAVICLRIDNACSKAASDKSIDSRNRLELSVLQDLLLIYSLVVESTIDLLPHVWGPGLQLTWSAQFRRAGSL